MQDTFNLLAQGIRQLGRALTKEAQEDASEWLRTHDLGRYTQSSLKGSADLDWSDEAAKEALLTEVVLDAKRLLGLATSFDVLAGDAGDASNALSLVEQSETNTGMEVADSTGGLRLWRGTDAPSLCRGRAGVDGQGASGSLSEGTVWQERF